MALLPKGPVVVLVERAAAQVQAERSPLGERLVVRGGIGGLLRYTQTLTLWHGVDRVDCRTTIDEFTGADRLLRLRWPCPVPGALPVSEVGDAVIGRGFGLMHDHGPTTPSTPRRTRGRWTTPRTGGSGLSSARAGPRRRRRPRAVSVAEVVPADGRRPAALARDLVVALVRAGVTATCSSADRPATATSPSTPTCPTRASRSAGPTRTPSPQPSWPAPTRPTPRSCERQLDADGGARVWVPADDAAGRRWVPGADLRGAARAAGAGAGVGR